MSTLVELADVFFNGAGSRFKGDPKPAEAKMLAEMVKRKKSIVRVGKKYYRFTVEEVQLEVKDPPSKVNS